MNGVPTRVQNYLVEGLAHAGFVVVDAGVARMLRPDIWAAGSTSCGMDFSTPTAEILRFLSKLEGVSVIEVSFSEAPEKFCPVAHRGGLDLDDRVGHITGLVVADMREYREPKAPEPKPAEAPAVPVDEPPPYPCIARTRWFQKRGLPDPMATPTKFPPRRDAGITGPK